MDATTIDRPFGLPADPDPIVHVLDLPLPPSVNEAYEINGKARRKMHRSAAYKAWSREAGLTLMCAGKLRGRKMIGGKFETIIEIRRDWTMIEPNKFDIDNRVKALLDFCQEYRFIQNDKQNEDLHVKWTHDNAPRGCRITLRSCE